jgi:hypothetical protein
VLLRRENVSALIPLLGAVIGFVAGQLTGLPIGGLVGAGIGASIAIAGNVARVRRQKGRAMRAAGWLAERAAKVVNERTLFGPSVATSCDPVEHMSVRELATLTRNACLRIDPACADPVWRAPWSEINALWQSIAQLAGQLERDLSPDVERAQRELQHGLAGADGAAHLTSLAWRHWLQARKDGEDLASAHSELQQYAEDLARATAECVAAAEKLERLARSG